MSREYDHSSFRNKLKSSICCFHSDEDEDHTSSPYGSTPPSPPLTWLKSTAYQLPDQLRGRCRYLKDRIGHARTKSSFDFSYDPSSYALNFDDDSRIDDEFPLRYFAGRTSGFISPVK